MQAPRANRIGFPGRVAQWESARFTRERSLVRNQPRPCRTERHSLPLMRSAPIADIGLDGRSSGRRASRACSGEPVRKRELSDERSRTDSRCAVRGGRDADRAQHPVAPFRARQRDRAVHWSRRCLPDGDPAQVARREAARLGFACGALLGEHADHRGGLLFGRTSKLFGDQVALEARIIAVADVYGAMTSDRS